MQVINRPSDKYNGNADVRVVCLHHTAGSEASDLATLWGPAEVSIHAYITKAGTIYLGVPFGKRAWHAGSPTYWNGLTDINSYSIGIELENWGNGVDPFPQAQLDALDYCLVSLIRPLYGNLPITRHRDILAEKSDPADNFPWGSYSGGIAQVMNRSGVSISGGSDVSMTQPEAHLTGKGKWVVPWYDFVSPGVSVSNLIIYVPSAQDVGIIWRLFGRNPATAAVVDFKDGGRWASQQINLSPGQPAVWNKKGYQGPVEVDLNGEGYVDTSFIYQP